MAGKSIDKQTLWHTTTTSPDFDPYTGDVNPFIVKGDSKSIVVKDEVPERYNSQTGEEKAVRDFEMTYPTLAQAWKEIQDEQYILFARKMMDYGISNISLGSNLEEQEDIELSLTGIWLRVNDKINRLKNLLKRKGRNYVTNEPMIDSFLDIANYGIIAMLVIRNKWRK